MRPVSKWGEKMLEIDVLQCPGAVDANVSCYYYNCKDHSDSVTKCYRRQCARSVHSGSAACRWLSDAEALKKSFFFSLCWLRSCPTPTTAADSWVCCGIQRQPANLSAEFARVMESWRFKRSASSSSSSSRSQDLRRYKRDSLFGSRDVIIFVSRRRRTFAYWVCV